MGTLSFRDLHQPGNPFILANAWDVGSAKVLAALGAKAIGTTSAGHAFTLGVKDMGDITRDQSLAHARDLVIATPLPVSGDLENGYGHSPEEVVLTVLEARKAGLAGCSIEDSRLPNATPYDFELAVARIEVASDAAKSEINGLDNDFVLTARADGIMNAQYDTNEAIRRLQAFEAVGADVLYAPLPPSIDELARICREVKAPVNALVAGNFVNYSLSDFANTGVARVSLGSALSRVTHAAIVSSARDMFDRGDFSSFQNGIGGAEIENLFNSVN